MSEEEEPPLTEEEQQLVNDMCKRLDEMRMQSIRHEEEQTKQFAAIQDNLGSIHVNLDGMFKNLESMVSKLFSHDSISSIQAHGYMPSSPITPVKSVPLSSLFDPPDLNGSEIYQEAETFTKSVANVEIHGSIQEHESHEVIMGDCVPQFQVPISVIEPSHRVCDKSCDVFEELPYVIEKNNQVQFRFDLKCVDSKDNAYQMFDKMPIRKKRKQQRRKLSLSPKAWKFKYKPVDLLQVLPQRTIKKLHEMCSGYDLRAWSGLELCGREYNEQMSVLVSHGSKVQSNSSLISSCAHQIWEPGGPLNELDKWKGLKLGICGYLTKLIPTLGKETNFRYRVELIDVQKQTRTFAYDCDVFLAPKTRAHEWLFGSEKRQEHIVETSKLTHLIMIFLDNSYSDANLEGVQIDLFSMSGKVFKWNHTSFEFVYGSLPRPPEARVVARHSKEAAGLKYTISARNLKKRKAFIAHKFPTCPKLQYGAETQEKLGSVQEYEDAGKEIKSSISSLCHDENTFVMFCVYELFHLQRPPELIEPQGYIDGHLESVINKVDSSPAGTVHDIFQPMQHNESKLLVVDNGIELESAFDNNKVVTKDGNEVVMFHNHAVTKFLVQWKENPPPLRQGTLKMFMPIKVKEKRYDLLELHSFQINNLGYTFKIISLRTRIFSRGKYCDRNKKNHFGLV
ncbi:unnamed protein product [Cochlearia groenlandica]